MHLFGAVKRKMVMILVNCVFVGTRPSFFEIKRRLLNSIGYVIGEETKVVGPIECYGKLVIGKKCWIGKNLKVNGNGSVAIEDNCDLGPEITFQTGGHKIGDSFRRAGEGEVYNQHVGQGTWIGGRSTICNNTSIGKGCVIAGCSCVIHDVPENSLIGGVPAKIIRGLK